jgi:rhamnogalacturonan acetylesterase
MEHLPFMISRSRFLAYLAVSASLFALPSAHAAAPNADLPTVYLIGDSTVKNGTKGLQGWGTAIPTLFDLTKVNVVNSALGGRSSRTFLTEGLWDKVKDRLKPGDFVLMQFGHNDGGSTKTSYRASVKGIGDETQEIVNPKTNQRETVHSYGWYLDRYVTDAKAKGASPIVLSPIPRNIWKGDKVARSTTDYGLWAKQIAAKENVPFIDLNGIIADRYDALGPVKVLVYFPGDHTHTSPDGARLNAECVAAGIRGLTNSPLAAYLLPAATSPAVVGVPATAR